MKTDTMVKSEGFKALFEALGPVDAERFLVLLSHDRQEFDYTEWRRNLWADKSVEEVAALALSIVQQPKAGNSNGN